MKRHVLAIAFAALYIGWGQTLTIAQAPDRPEDVLEKAANFLGGDRYLNITSQVSRGRFSLMKDGAVISFQSFLDVIVFPDKERTEFRGGGAKHVQTNSGNSGWIFDGNFDRIRDQDEKQVANFQRSIRSSLDNLLRKQWRGQAKLEYVGRRQASLGKRNDVIKLTYDDGFEVEFEFAADTGVPAKAIHIRRDADGEAFNEEDRYAQFVDIEGVRFPFIIDRFTNGAHVSRINYESVEFNKPIPASIFLKPSDPKELKKDLKI
ncbi:MAG TPA: hypothetical protein PKD26_12165 [Pyrinomonadaceae bacterium]|nr:hypothetical protein [Pyrinomonadaceae bacterium]